MKTPISTNEVSVFFQTESSTAVKDEMRNERSAIVEIFTSLVFISSQCLGVRDMMI